jgi:hypothetical protein
MAGDVEVGACGDSYETGDACSTAGTAGEAEFREDLVIAGEGPTLRGDEKKYW